MRPASASDDEMKTSLLEEGTLQSHVHASSAKAQQLPDEEQPIWSCCRKVLNSAAGMLSHLLVILPLAAIICDLVAIHVTATNRHSTVGRTEAVVDRWSLGLLLSLLISWRACALYVATRPVFSWSNAAALFVPGAAHLLVARRLSGSQTQTVEGAFSKTQLQDQLRQLYDELAASESREASPPSSPPASPPPFSPQSSPPSTPPTNPASRRSDEDRGGSSQAADRPLMSVGANESSSRLAASQTRTTSSASSVVPRRAGFMSGRVAGMMSGRISSRARGIMSGRTSPWASRQTTPVNSRQSSRQSSANVHKNSPDARDTSNHGNNLFARIRFRRSQSPGGSLDQKHGSGLAHGPHSALNQLTCSRLPKRTETATVVAREAKGLSSAASVSAHGALAAKLCNMLDRS